MHFFLSSTLNRLGANPANVLKKIKPYENPLHVARTTSVFEASLSWRNFFLIFLLFFLLVYIHTHNSTLWPNLQKQLNLHYAVYELLSYTRKLITFDELIQLTLTTENARNSENASKDDSARHDCVKSLWCKQGTVDFLYRFRYVFFACSCSFINLQCAMLYWLMLFLPRCNGI